MRLLWASSRHCVAGLLCVALLLAGPAGMAAETFKAFKLKTIDGKERSLGDFPGRATLVVFFHPTCGYCNAALPELQSLDEKYKPQGLSVVWINVLPEENKMMAEWQKTHRLSAPVLAATGSVQRDYRITMTPTHYLIDANRTVLWKHAGYKAGDEASMQKEIERALTR